MEKLEYEDEIQLIQDQNDTEFELYPLVSDIIAPTLKNQNLSKRYVFARRKSDLGQIYYGISNFPDIAILDRDFKSDKHKEINLDNWKKLKGCVEAKAYNTALYDLNELQNSKEPLSGNGLKPIAQLVGDILWYKKVLYTNGVQWKLFELNFDLECKKRIVKYEEKIVEIVNDRIKEEQKEKKNDKKDEIKKKEISSETPFNWMEDSDIKHIIANNISEKIITVNCLEDWDEFKNKIEEINWKIDWIK